MHKMTHDDLKIHIKFTIKILREAGSIRKSMQAINNKALLIQIEV